VKVSQFDRWVNDNNIPETFEYAKGWWDYIELVRLLAFRMDTEDIRVVGQYVVDTPPPCERLPMPAVAIATPGVTFALRYDFGSWSLKHPQISEWVVSVQRRSPYRQDQARFSCILRDEWDVATLVRIMGHEA
jgi:hypothetical protein